MLYRFVVIIVVIMVMEITKGAENPILRKKDNPKYGKVTKKTVRLFKDMAESMLATNGVGIAAPQVGVNERLCIITINDNRDLLPMVNPEILERSEDTIADTEGCLSLPGKWGEVERAEWVKTRFTDVRGDEHVIVFRDFEARIVQHETDHLNGTLFIDHVPKGKLSIEE